jgi:hypothetical protein
MVQLAPGQEELWTARGAAMGTGLDAPHAYDTFSDVQSDFRLLTLLPSTSDVSELEVRLHIARLLPTPLVYEALYYVWQGDSSASDSKPCPLRVGIGKLTISRTLANILFHLRDASKPRTLWGDALCIDQASLMDRNHQLPNMYDIYSMAQRMVMWLGKEVVKNEFSEEEVLTSRQMLDSRYTQLQPDFFRSS